MRAQLDAADVADLAEVPQLVGIGDGVDGLDLPSVMSRPITAATRSCASNTMAPG